MELYNSLKKYNKMEYDSRKIEENDIFVALEGAVVDGHNYIDIAIKKGAKCILHSKEIEKVEGIEYFNIDNLRKKLGEIASNFYDFPQKKLKIIGVTGTNGKTTTTYLIEELLREPVTRIGTVEYKIGSEVIEAPNTTPESLDLIKMCKKSVDLGIKYLIMEVSSHALMLGRVNMLDFDISIFTNLTPEHLDFHKDMEEYYMAKGLIFKQTKEDGVKIINIDDQYGKKYFNEFSGTSYSLENGDILAKALENGVVRFTYKEESVDVVVPLLGKYNLYNILAALGAVVNLGVHWKVAVERVKELKGAPGRFENISCGQDFTAIVDYAHTGDALENLLKTVKELNYEEVITVFGCGGDRDNKKRPEMARIAEMYSDIVIATSDNPRTEDINKIMDDIVAGFHENNHIVEIDREKAIIKAVKLAKKNSIIVVAGKGHEAYQILGTKKIHFDDREYLRREIIRKMEGK